MGHIHLATLPGTKKWREVAELLSSGATDDEVLAKSAEAAERLFAAAPNNPVFIAAVRLLSLIPVAAKREDFSAGLRELGINVPPDPHLTDLTVGVHAAIEQAIRASGRRDDFAEIVRRSLLSTLVQQIGDRLPGLLTAEAADVRKAAAIMGRPREFSAAARAFFGAVTARSLSYWLDRTLSAQVGPEERFPDSRARGAFDAALAQYSSEATRIIREFAGGWYGKTLYTDGTVTPARAAAFSAIAFRKITEELHYKRGLDA